MSEDFFSLYFINYDWANWDETYAFVEDANEDYINKNLPENAYAYTQFRNNLIIYVNSAGKNCLQEGLGPAQRKRDRVPASLKQCLAGQ
ncbi:MAG: CHASE4 domain-containing protein [Desulfotomaculaceae bacterium]|nr:CHASE4 domain-containing protein [Desulfotomaculaceae bacterium]